MLSSARSLRLTKPTALCRSSASPAARRPTPTFAALIAHLRRAHVIYQHATDQGEESYYNVYWYLLQALEDDEAQHGYVERFRDFAWKYGVTLEAET